MWVLASDLTIFTEPRIQCLQAKGHSLDQKLDQELTFSEQAGRVCRKHSFRLQVPESHNMPFTYNSCHYEPQPIAVYLKCCSSADWKYYI